jgi:23S rRNA pseudouridine2457 synthase
MEINAQPRRVRLASAILPAAFSRAPAPVLLALHKPYGVLSQFTPEPGSAWKTLSALGRAPFAEGPRLPPAVYPLGRLDADSEGLLLLSDEPGLNTRLLDPRHRHPREYWTLVERVPAPESLARLAAGLRLPDHACAPLRVRPLRADEIARLPPRDPPVRLRKTVTDTWLALELHEGKNRQVRRMTAALGHPTLRLLRTRIGTLTLEGLGLLPRPGAWVTLDTAQRAAVFAASPEETS